MDKDNKKKTEEQNKPIDKEALKISKQFELFEHISDTVTDSIKEFVRAKYSQDNKGQLYFFIIVLFIITAIGVLAYFDKLSSELTGTLLASIIGYAVGKYGQIKNNGKSDE